MSIHEIVDVVEDSATARESAVRLVAPRRPREGGGRSRIGGSRRAQVGRLRGGSGALQSVRAKRAGWSPTLRMVPSPAPSANLAIAKRPEPSVSRGRLTSLDVRSWQSIDLAIKAAAVVLAILVVVTVGVVLGSGAAIPVGDAVVVQVGDTLWSLASSIPEVPSVGIAVADIQELNGLASDSLAVGQNLVLPRY